MHLKKQLLYLHRNYANGLVVQLVRMPACHAGGREFESRPDRKKLSKFESFFFDCNFLKLLRFYIMKRILFALVILIVSIISVVFFIEKNDELDIDQVDEIASKYSIKIEPERFYGYSLDSFSVEESIIKKNQNLGDILWENKIFHNKIFNLVNVAKPVFDVRKIRGGNKYFVLKSKSKGDTLQILIYEKNKIEYVVFDLREEYSVEIRKKEIKRETKIAQGIINSSLYLTLQEQDVTPELALKMSDIYAWSIDFYRIQKGDSFKVVYDELLVEGESVGIDNIKTCVFNHAGGDFYAFQFMQDSILDYYDEEGKSLRKAFLKAPLKFSRISSRFTYKRFHPVQKRWKAHLGTDYAAPRGTPIQATGDGVVSEARYKKYNGNYVKIRHNSTYSTQYLHMSKIASGIRPGTRVKQGQTIGFVGSTGLATGPHVCYRFWKNGAQVDPYKQKIPASKPVKEENLSSFKEEMNEQMKMLN